MKKTLLAIITVSLLVCSANAQIKKGSVFLGGDISGSTQKTKSGDVTTNKQNGINISPVFGKAIKENLVLGVNAGLGIYDNKYPAGNNTNFKTNSYGAGVFLRKYKNIGTNGFYLFVQGGLGVNYMTQEHEGPFAANFNELKRISVGINAYPGLSYAVSRKLHLETGFNNLLTLNYFHDKLETGSPVTTSKTNGFSIASSLNNATSYLYLGFRLLVGK
ncbi:MAG: hypothetical protein ACXWV2_00515 [Chitinophagaceae bacterium]